MSSNSSSDSTQNESSEDRLFVYNFEIKVPKDVKNVEFDPSVTEIHEKAFEECGNLSVIHIPEGVMRIRTGAFSNCSSLTKISLPSSLTNIEKGAFSKCFSLTEIIFPLKIGVTEIHERTFEDCPCLSAINIPEGIASIGAGAFSNCSSLTKINLPTSLTNVGEGAFSKCFSLAEIILPSKLTIIAKQTFKACFSLTDISLPSDLIEIGEGAFERCSGLTSINLPSSITTIRKLAFFECSSLTSVYFPSSLIIIESSAFLDCSSLKNVDLPSNLKSLGEGAFEGCSSVTKITISSSLASIQERTFAKCSSLAYIDLPSSLASIGARTFSYCTSLINISIPPLLTGIQDGVFFNCLNLKSVIFPPNLIIIGAESFAYCSSLANVNFPSSLTSIGKEAFYYCQNMTNIDIPPVLTSIGKGAFSHCSNLMKVSLPPSLTTIAEAAFFKCEKLLIVNLLSENIEIGTKAFFGCDGLLGQKDCDSKELLDLLNNRFQSLPFHSICNSTQPTIERIEECIQNNIGCEKERDEIGLTPLHVLALNKYITKDSLKRVIEAFPPALTTQCALGLLPQHLLLHNPKITIDFFTSDIVKAKTLDCRYAISIMTDDKHTAASLAIKLSHSADIQLRLYSYHPVNSALFGDKVKYIKQLKDAENRYLHNILNPPSKRSMENWDFLKQHGWVQCLTTLSQKKVDDISKFIKSEKCEFILAKSLAYARNHEDKMALDVADPKIREALEEKILFLGRYEMSRGLPLYKSSTCIVKKATDTKNRVYYSEVFRKFATENLYLLENQLIDALIFMGVEFDEERISEIQNAWDKDSDGKIDEEEFQDMCKEYVGRGSNRQVALKFMKHEDQFIGEIGIRSRLQKNSKSLIHISSTHNQNEDEQIKLALEGFKPVKLEDNLNVYKFLIIMNLADRNLEEIIRSELPNQQQVRTYLKDIAQCLNDLHGDCIIHGDLKPSNIVRYGEKLRLIDFDASSEIYSVEKEDDCENPRYFAGRKFSSGSLPPEMIFKCIDYDNQTLKTMNYFRGENDVVRQENHDNSDAWIKFQPKQSERTKKLYLVKTFSTEKIMKEEATGELKIVEVMKKGLPYEPLKSSPSMDLWALGTILYFMSTGQHLFSVDINGNLQDGATMEELYEWNEERKEEKLKRVNDPAAKELLKKLLTRDPEKRGSIRELLENHSFFQSDSPLPEMNDDLVEGEVTSFEELKMDEVKPVEVLEKVTVQQESSITKLSQDFSRKIEESSSNLIKMIFETKELDIPTSCIILPFKVFENKEPIDTIEMENYVSSILSILKRCLSPLDFAQELSIKGIFDEFCFLYLIDEYDGTIVPPTGPYPIQIEKSFVPFQSILSMMFISLKSLTVLKSARDFARVFSPGVPVLKEKQLKIFEEYFDVETNGTSMYDAVQMAIKYKEVKRGDELKEFELFLLENDPGQNFSGMIRMFDWLNANTIWVSEKCVKINEKDRSLTNSRLNEDVANTNNRNYTKKLVSENVALQEKVISLQREMKKLSIDYSNSRPCSRWRCIV